MIVVSFGNTLNRHQSNVSDALYNLLDGNYIYVETVPPTYSNLFGGKAKVDRSYVLEAYKNKTNYSESMQLAREADVVLFGADSFSFQLERMRHNNLGITFEVSERIMKRGWFNLLSPRLLKKIWYYHTHRWSHKALYKLCSSAFAARDQYKLHTFKNRCYKWGYFTKVDDIDVAGIISGRNHFNMRTPISNLRFIRLMWCARFLRWKHPEMPVYLASLLKSKGYSFILDMYGAGNQLDTIKALSSSLDLDDVISFMGNVSNDEIISAMRQHDIFLFTSDRREGWGAVLNEAMSNGCAVIASNTIGSVPFLINDGINGCTFNSNDLDSLYEKTRYLLDNKEIRENIAVEAYKTMRDIWSPYSAAKNLLVLCNNLLLSTGDNPISSGPCSKATP